jgi:hypothetical protein
VKFVISAVIIIGLFLGARQFYQYWGTFKTQPASHGAVARVQVADDQLPGLPAALQPALEQARQHGAAGLRSFLAAHGDTIDDPRRASLELDYAVLVTASNPTEACRVFAKVKERLDPNSPVYDRMKRLEKTYE